METWQSSEPRQLGVGVNPPGRKETMHRNHWHVRACGGFASIFDSLCTRFKFWGWLPLKLGQRQPFGSLASFDGRGRGGSATKSASVRKSRSSSPATEKNSFTDSRGMGGIPCESKRCPGHSFPREKDSQKSTTLWCACPEQERIRASDRSSVGWKSHHQNRKDFLLYWHLSPSIKLSVLRLSKSALPLLVPDRDFSPLPKKIRGAK